MHWLRLKGDWHASPGFRPIVTGAECALDHAKGQLGLDRFFGEPDTFTLVLGIELGVDLAVPAVHAPDLLVRSEGFVILDGNSEHTLTRGAFTPDTTVLVSGHPDTDDAVSLAVLTLVESALGQPNVHHSIVASDDDDFI
jgi:hypothetical protein